MKNCRGAGLVEFILILPWVVGIVLALVAVAIWVLQGHLMHYAAHKQSRLLSLYQTDKAEAESQLIYPRPIVTHAPLHFSLNGVQLDLLHQDKQDAWRQPQMDNPIPFCGEEGNYALCSY
ncbi:MAG: pilus assembly protein [Deltaproteobacteria bacterium]|nr:pilus assembly protein [Deltaproteobacteria bacterium]